MVMRACATLFHWFVYKMIKILQSISGATTRSEAAKVANERSISQFT